jgi:Flp pilus assembly pilin Flp
VQRVDKRTVVNLIFVRFRFALLRLLRSEHGQGLTEYALILALIAVVAIAALHYVSAGVNRELTSVATSL